MTDRDALGNSYDDGLLMTINGPNGPIDVKLSLADLASPERTRAAWYAATGWEMPHYSTDDHIEIVKVMMRLAGYVETPERPRPLPRRATKRRRRRR